MLEALLQWLTRPGRWTIEQHTRALASRWYSLRWPVVTLLPPPRRRLGLSTLAEVVHRTRPSAPSLHRFAGTVPDTPLLIFAVPPLHAIIRGLLWWSYKRWLVEAALFRSGFLVADTEAPYYHELRWPQHWGA